jgi:hypothetical protein
VGFDEFGRYAGTEPYIKEEVERNLLIRLAQEKGARIFGHDKA